MSTLTTDQGLILPEAPDGDNVPLSFADYVLGASDDGAESRLVKRYLSAADRTARNPSPNPGELSYRIDGASFEYWNGSTWLALRPGFVGETIRTTSIGSITTTETVLDSVTFTAVAGTRYKVTANLYYQSTVGNDLVQIRLRWQAGGTLTTAGSEFHVALMNCDVAGRGGLAAMVRTVTGLSGQVTVGTTMVRNAGTGTLISSGSPSAQPNVLLAEIV